MGGKFADIARATSQGPPAARGGDIGSFRHGQPPTLDNVAFHMKTGDVSDVLCTGICNIARDGCIPRRPGASVLSSHETGEDDPVAILGTVLLELMPFARA